MWSLIFGLFQVTIMVVIPSCYIKWQIVIIFCCVFCMWKPKRNEKIRKADWVKQVSSSVKVNIKVLHDKKIRNTAQYIFAFHPHYYFSFAEMMTFVFDLDLPFFKDYVNNTVPLVSSLLLWVPILGHIARAFGCEDISKENLLNKLENNKNVALSPGGTREIMLSDLSDETKVVIIKRHGFLKVSYMKKIPVVPIISTGESKLHTFYFTRNRMQKFMQNMIGYPFPFFALGRYFSFWPKKGNVDVWVGKPLNPSDYKSEKKYIESYYKNIIKSMDKHDIKVELKEVIF